MFFEYVKVNIHLKVFQYFYYHIHYQDAIYKVQY